MKKTLTLYKLQLCIFLFLLYGCVPGSTSKPIAALPKGCTTPGTVISAELPQPTPGSTYSYEVYLPPCYSLGRESYYPILYLVPGRSSSPASWFAAGLPDVLDRMILSNEIPPMIVVATENIDNDPLADAIYTDLLPFIENQ